MRSRGKRVLGTMAGGAALSLVLAGCSSEQLGRGFLPGEKGTTNRTDMVAQFWTTSWVLLLVIGVIVWGLIIWAVIAYRRRKGDTGYPPQMRYNMPIEMLYTILPLILILGFFAFTARDQSILEARAADETSVLKVEAIGQQWTWQFNYLTDDVHEAPGMQAQYRTGPTFDESTLPTLYLPVATEVEVQLGSRDVAHSFWVPDFLYKKDTIPGRTNYWTFTPERIGTYRGKCAELCGEFHSSMLFNVKVVSKSDYAAHIASLRSDGLTGTLGHEYDRNQNQPGTASQPPVNN